jgi:thiamine pyrophosphate-dependent acetolactate synthase large subunit-like protein
MSTSAYTDAMDRLELTRRLVDIAGPATAIVAGIGNTNFDLHAAAPDRPENFYMLGSMGLAVPIGLGLACSQPERQVIVLEGDGSLLMSLGVLATVAAVAPANLTIVAWDNGVYAITGNQAAATAEGADLVAVARGAGVERSDWARDPEDFARLVGHALRSQGPSFIGARVSATPGASRPPRDPVILKDRFMRAVGAV